MNNLTNFISLMLLIATLPCAAAQQWLSIADQSQIKFIASYDNAEFEGQFTRFSSQFNIDPDNITASKLLSNIDVTSANTQSRDRDQALAEEDWFYFSKFPQATFSSQSITIINDNLLEVTGLLTIRDQQKEITFPMQWQVINDQRRQAQARFTLDRRDYNIGIGEWLEDETIGFNVQVIFSVTYELAN